MYFKNFPSYLYDFNYGNGVTKTTVVKDITRNMRVKKDILRNISLYDEYDIVDGETPEIISEKFYGTPEYHWIVMLANDKYDYISDFPMSETYLQKHIETSYNPVLTSVDWHVEDSPVGEGYGYKTIYFKVAGLEPFDPAYLISKVSYTLTGQTDQHEFSYTFTWPDGNGVIIDFGGHYDQHFYQHLTTKTPIEGNPTGTLTVTTKNREHNPVYFINEQGYRVNAGTPGALPVTGDQIHRRENDIKRRIKIISPSLVETILKNYEDIIK